MKNHSLSGSLYTSTGHRKYLTRAERERFLDAAASCPRPDLRTLCLVLAYTGCRISEALALTAHAVERDAGFVAIRCLKKRHGALVYREVPLPPAVVAELAAVHDLAGGGRLWPLSRGRAWQLVKAIMRKAGIQDGPHATPKGLRHGFGLHAVQCGVPLNLVQRWLGHASLTTTAIYLQAMGDEERSIAARMWSDVSHHPAASHHH